MTDLSPNVVDSSGIDRPGDTYQHGTAVAMILGARGDNGQGMTGMMWRVQMDLRDASMIKNGLVDVDPATGKVNASSTLLLQQILVAIDLGARVVNLSQGRDTTAIGVVPSALYTKYAGFAADFKRELPNWAPGKPAPLIVIAAGNNAGADPIFSLFPVLADSFPATTLVVGAASRTADSVFVSVPVGSRRPPDVMAPGELVSSVTQNGKASWDGTSMAAPLISGIAGLLFSFDPNLTPAEVKQHIVQGAVAGGRKAGSFPLANAYESLKLAARRTGAPLCGNRVWASGTNINVERGTTTQIIPTGLPATDTIRNISVQHGGKRIEVGTVQQRSNGVVSAGTILTLNNGTWSSAPYTGLPPQAPIVGGTYRSLKGYSHNVDTILAVTDVGNAIRLARYNIASGTGDEVSIPYGPFPVATIDGFNYPLEHPSRVQSAFPMNGDTAWVAITFYHYAWSGGGESPISFASGPKEVRLYRLNLAVSPFTVSLVKTVPDTAVFWLGLSEDGREKVVATGRDSVWNSGPADSVRLTNCRIRWSKPRFSDSSGFVFDDSVAPRKSVAAGPEGCSIPKIGDNDLIGAGSIAPRFLPGRRPFIPSAPPPAPTAVKRAVEPRTRSY
jgi:hypothetical protein